MARLLIQNCCPRDLQQEAELVLLRLGRRLHLEHLSVSLQALHSSVLVLGFVQNPFFPGAGDDACEWQGRVVQRLSAVIASCGKLGKEYPF